MENLVVDSFEENFEISSYERCYDAKLLLNEISKSESI